MKREPCPKCGLLLVTPIGPKDAKLLFVGEYPSFEDVRYGAASSGKIGDALRSELARIGIQKAACRITNLWQHAQSKSCDSSWHLEQVTKELDRHDWVILMGSEITKVLLGRGIMEVAGLEVKSKLFPKIKFFAIPNPASLIHGDVGETRLALEKFKERMKKK
jgi:uracil-DNA glycosylase family 4